MSDESTPPDSGTPPTPPPAEGSAPPPPPPLPSYSAPPPQAPPAPAPGAAGGAYNAVEALQYGWAKFSKSPSTILIPGLIFLAGVIVVEAVTTFIAYATILGTHDCTSSILGTNVTIQCGPGFITALFGRALISFVASILISALGAGLIKCALNLVDGQEVNAGDVLGYMTKTEVLITAAIIGALTFVGTLLCIVPGIIVSFLTTFAMFFVVDKGMAPVDAIKASVSFMTSRLGDTVVFFLLSIVAIIVGLIACLVGVFVAAPVVVIAAAYTFRMLHNEPVSPVA